VLCEKPLAGDLNAARDMVRAAAEADVPTACCFENRWNPDWLAVADRVRSGFLGTQYLARVSRSASYWHPSHPLQAQWMYDREQGGGYLAGMLVHDLDFLCSLLGRPASVCAEVRTSDPVRELPDGGTLNVTADDTAALLMRMESGVTVVLSLSVMGAHADHYRLELFGSAGTIIGDGDLRSAAYSLGAASDDGLSPLTVDEREPAHPERLPGGLAGHASRAMALMLQDWLPAFDGAPSGAATFEDGLLSLAVIDAAHRSAEGGGWESVQA
jgi:predicted dehydrogenase